MRRFLNRGTTEQQWSIVLVLCTLAGSQTASGWSELHLLALQSRPPSASVYLQKPDPVVGLVVRNIEFERGPSIDAMPSTDVTFELLNDTLSRYKDIVLEVSVIQGPAQLPANTKPTVIVGPLTLRTNVALEPGYMMIFEIRFRNLAADCDCDVSVDVASAVLAPEP
jgi:hypothetical protein